MLILDARDANQDSVDQLKLALVSADPKRWLPTVFSSWAPQPEGLPPVQQWGPAEQVDDFDLAAEEDGEGGAWRFGDDVPPEEAAALLARLSGLK